MRSFNRLLSTLCLLLLAFSSRADIAAGEITYQWISDSTYRIYFKGYFECTGTTEPLTMPLCIVNTCSTITSSGTLTKTSTTVLPPSCASFPTKCSLPSSNLPGYKEVIYSTLVTLPSRCTDWRFSVTNSSRDVAVNTAFSSFYTEASLNNTGTFQGNSSPYFNRIPIEYIAYNESFAYNSNTIEPNGDSIVTDIVPVKTNTGCNLGSSVSLNSSSPSLSIPANPFQTNLTTTLNSASGLLTFTPKVLGHNICALRVREFRNGTLIGYVTRDLRFLVISAPAPTYTIAVSPIFQLVNCVIGSNGFLIGCPGTTMSYSFIAYASDTNTILSVRGISPLMPAPTYTYVNQNSDSVRVTFTWNVPLSAIGTLYNSIYEVKDTTCLAPGIVRYKGFVFPFAIHDSAKAGADTFICQGSSMTLSGGSNWSIISGTPGSLSCTTCSNPVVTPTTKSVYLSYVPLCPNLRDSVTIDVKNITAPFITVSAAPGINISSGTPVTFTATTTNCANPAYQWKKNGVTIPGASLATYNTSALANGDIIACQLTCNDTCPNPKVQTQQVTMIVTNGVAKLISESDIVIAPNPNNGIFTISTQAEKAEKYNLQVYNNLGQSVYKTQTIILGNGNNKQIDLSHLPAGIYTLMLNEAPYKITITK